MVQQFNSPSPDQLDEKTTEPRDVYEELASIREALNQTRTEMSLHRRRIDRRQDEVDAHIHRTNILLVTFLLAAVVSAAVWLGFRNKDALASRFPEVFNGAEVRPSSPKEKPPEENPVQNPAAGVEQSSLEQSDADPVDHLPQRESTVSVDAVPKTERPLNTSSTNAQLLADGVSRDRIDFKISLNKTEEVAPGIYLTVRDTNVVLQQTNGWLQIAEDGRAVQFRDLGAQKVMTFSTKRDGRNRELVFTRVDKNGVVGYLLIPVKTG